MVEFWEKTFYEKQEMWGWEPASSALKAWELFQKYGLHNILIPGFGYGRNARVFAESGLEITGIEISETAIDLARKHFGENVTIYHASVNAMPCDEKLYDGIFCYALIHLLNNEERTHLIQACYEQLQPNGYMIFVSISKMDFRYKKGQEIAQDTFSSFPGVNLYFYDSDSITRDFGEYGLLEAIEIDEPSHHAGNAPAQKFWYIVCKKKDI